MGIMRNMGWRLAALLAMGWALTACGSDAANAIGSEGGECFPDQSCGGGLTCSDGQCVTPCTTVRVTTTEVVDEVKAAFCFVLAYSDSLTCRYEAELDESVCENDESRVDFRWMEEEGIGRVARAIDTSDGRFLGLVTKLPNGTFYITYSDFDYNGSCTVSQDAATLCPAN